MTAPAPSPAAADGCPEWVVTYRCELPAGHEGWHRSPDGSARGTAPSPAAESPMARLLDLGDPVPWRMPVEIAAVAPSPAAAGLPAEDVERVARALADADGWTTNGTAWDVSTATERDSYRRLAAAALAEMRPTAAEEAVWEARRDAPGVHTSCDKWIKVERGEHGTRLTLTEPERGLCSEQRSLWANLSPRAVRELVTDLRAALAPVPHDADGGERR